MCQNIIFLIFTITYVLVLVERSLNSENNERAGNISLLDLIFIPQLLAMVAPQRYTHCWKGGWWTFYLKRCLRYTRH